MVDLFLFLLLIGNLLYIRRIRDHLELTRENDLDIIMDKLKDLDNGSNSSNIDEHIHQ